MRVRRTTRLGPIEIRQTRQKEKLRRESCERIVVHIDAFTLAKQFMVILADVKYPADYQFQWVGNSVTSHTNP